MKKLAAMAALAVTLSTPAWAATKTVTLSVPGMTCAACPITVKKALSKVAGVEKAEVSFEKREAVVTFDDVTVRVNTEATELAPGESFTHSYTLYNGPVKPLLLSYLTGERITVPVRT